MKILFSDKLTNYDFLNKIGLYKIINIVNGSWYVGSTSSTFRKRFSTHRKQLRNNKHFNQHLQNAYNKYGEKNFIFEILKSSKKNRFLEEEQKIIDENFGKDYFYNSSKDASAPMSGRKHTVETILKLRAASKKRSKEIGDEVRARWTGGKHTSKTIKKMRISAKNRDDSKRISVLQSKEYRDKMSVAMTGRTWSSEQRKKQEKTMQSEEYRERMSKATKGIKKSSEMKAKASMARMGKVITLIKDDIKETLLSLRNFCEKHKINRHEISNLIKGKRTEYKGWRLYLK